VGGNVSLSEVRLRTPGSAITAPILRMAIVSRPTLSLRGGIATRQILRYSSECDSPVAIASHSTTGLGRFRSRSVFKARRTPGLNTVRPLSPGGRLLTIEEDGKKLGKKVAKDSRTLGHDIERSGKKAGRAVEKVGADVGEGLRRVRDRLKPNLKTK